MARSSLGAQVMQPPNSFPGPARRWISSTGPTAPGLILFTYDTGVDPWKTTLPIRVER
jgi:hypothetical protein